MPFLYLFTFALQKKMGHVYYKTNNIYSLYLAKDYLLKDDTLLLESDLIFDEGLVRDMVFFPYATAAAVAKWEAWMDGTVVELSGDNEIGAFIPKKAFLYDKKETHYKTVNMYKFSKDFSANTYMPFWRLILRRWGITSIMNRFCVLLQRLINVI
jgi:choline kinase